MQRITLDTNCLVDLEEGNDRAAAVRDLVCRHERGRIQLRIPAIAASERQQGGTYLENFSDFAERLARLGLGSIPLVPPMLYLGMAFLGHALLPGGKMIELERDIHSILHPEIEFEYRRFCETRAIDPEVKPLGRKWLNAKCDVQGNTLVTNDENFLKASKLPRLIGLSAGAVVRTADAPAHLDRLV